MTSETLESTLEAIKERNDEEIVKQLRKRIEIKKSATKHIASKLNGSDATTTGELLQQLPIPTAPLQLSAWIGLVEITEALLQAGYKCSNLENSTGLTAIHVAAYKGNKEVLIVLLQHADNVNVLDAQGRTAIYLSCCCGHLEIVKYLLENGSDVNQLVSPDTEMATSCLHAACLMGHSGIVELLLNNNATLTAIDSAGRTALHICALEGRLQIAKILLSNGMTENKQDITGKTPLHTCLSMSNTHVLEEQKQLAELLMKTTDLKLLDNKRCSVLHGAAYWDCASLIEYYMKRCTDILATDETGKSPLHYAFMNPSVIGLDAAQVLLSNGADMKCKDIEGNTPLSLLMSHPKATESGVQDFIRDYCRRLANSHSADTTRSPFHVAAVDGDVTQISYLLKCGVDVDLMEANTGNTALHIAVINGRSEAVELLKECGASVNLQNFQQMTPLHYAAFHQFKTIGQILLAGGASLELKDESGLTPLHNACGFGSLPVVKLLVDSGSQVNDLDFIGQRPIHLACEKGKQDTVKYLLSKGAKCSVQDKDGVSPLHMCSRQGHSEVARLLVENGAELNLTDKNLQAPLHLACFYGKQDVASLLVNSGCDPILPDSQGQGPMDVAVEMGNTEIAQVIRKHSERERVHSNDIKLNIEGENTHSKSLVQSAETSAGSGIKKGKGKDQQLANELYEADSGPQDTNTSASASNKTNTRTSNKDSKMGRKISSKLSKTKPSKASGETDSASRTCSCCVIS